MSHTTRLIRGWHAIHNGDFSGDVDFYRVGEDEEEPHIERLPDASIPFDVIVELVAEAVRTSAISTLEDATVVDLIPGLDPHFLTGGPEADAARAERGVVQGLDREGQVCRHTDQEGKSTFEPHPVDRVDGKDEIVCRVCGVVRQVTTTDVKAPCSYCMAAASVRPTGGVCPSCWYDTGNVNGRRCVERTGNGDRCPNDSLGTSQHCAAHQRRHNAVEDEGVEEPRCSVCLEPEGYPIHFKSSASVS